MGSNYEFIVDTKDKTHVYYDKLNNRFLKIKDDIITEVNSADREYDALVYIKKYNNKRIRRALYIAIVAMDIILLGAECNYVANKEKEYVPIVKEYDYGEDELDKLIEESLAENSYLTDKEKVSIKEYVKQYIDRCEVYGVDYTDTLDTILTNIKSINGTSVYAIVNDEIKECYLEQIFTFKNGKFIANSLLNQTSGDTYISNYLYFHDNAMRLVLAGKDITISHEGTSYTFNLDDVDSIEFTVKKILKEYEDDESNRLSLGDFKTNIFSNILESDTYPYTRFYERNYDKDGISLKEITSKHYFELLANKLYNLPDNIDYYDKDTRNIVYLYANALLVNSGIQKNFETTAYIINSTADDKRMAAFSRRDLYEYLLGEELDYTFINCLAQIGYYDGGVGLLTTVDKCLKIDLAENNITQEKYDEFYDGCIAYLTINGGDSLETFLNAHIHDEIANEYKLEIIHQRTA